jgi:molybdopterin-guanine dinucleotide biosynthesis protein A
MLQLGGKLMLARVADTLRPLCDELVLVVRPGQGDDTPDTGIALRMHVVTDTEPFTGPLAALHAGLKAAVTPLAFVTGADHPFLSRPLIRAMLSAAMSSGGSPESVSPRSDGKLHPLHTVYVVKDWLPVVAQALEAGERAPLRLLERALETGEPPLNVMTEDEVEALDPRRLSLLDIDTPAQLAFAREVIDPRRVLVRPDIRKGGV